MAINMIGRTDHLRMAKSVLSDLRNRGFEEHASIIFCGDEEKVNMLDNIMSDNGIEVDRAPFDAGVVEIPSLGLVASIGPVYGFLADSAQAPEGGFDVVCNDMGIGDEGQRMMEEWLEQGKYVLLINGAGEDQVNFLRNQLGEIQGIHHLTLC